MSKNSTSVRIIPTKINTEAPKEVRKKITITATLNKYYRLLR